MNFRKYRLDRIELSITEWMAGNGILFLRLAIGIIFIWFGAVKFLKDMSPAETLAIKTIDKLTFQLLTDDIIRIGLAIFEVMIGLGLMFRLFLRTTIIILFLHMLGTFTPLFFFPDEIFYRFPYSLTLEGQYIIKNIVIIAAGMVIGATVRGGGLKSTPDNKIKFSH